MLQGHILQFFSRRVVAPSIIMESAGGTMCPVCTLYLRPGITLKHHLTSHPKQKVIEALVQFSTSNASRLQTTQPQTNGLPTGSKCFLLIVHGVALEICSRPPSNPSQHATTHESVCRGTSLEHGHWTLLHVPTEHERKHASSTQRFANAIQSVCSTVSGSCCIQSANDALLLPAATTDHVQ